MVDAYTPYLERMDRPPAPMLSHYASLIGSGMVWVARSNGKTIGVMVVDVGRFDAAHIDNIAVTSGAQGRGIGLRLLQKAIGLAIDCGLGRVELFTYEVMVESLDFYL